MKIIIENKEFNSTQDVLIYYGYTKNDLRKETLNGGNIYSLLNVSGIVEEDLSKEDKKCLKGLIKNKYDTTYIYKLLTYNQRQKIMRRHYKGWDASLIASDLIIDYTIVKIYLTIRFLNKTISGKKKCILCSKFKDVDKFWKSGKYYSTKCSECINKERRERRRNDPEYRAKIAKEKKKSYMKNKLKEVNIDSYAYRTRTPERKKKMDSLRLKSYYKTSSKKQNNKIAKVRLLNNNNNNNKSG